MSVSNKNKPLLHHSNHKIHEATARLAKSGDLELVLTTLKDEYIQVLIGTEPSDRETREECYVKIMTLDDLQTWVKNYGAKRES